MAEIEDHIRLTITDDKQPFPMLAALLRKLGGVAEVTEADLDDVDGMVLDMTLYGDDRAVLRLEKDQLPADFFGGLR